MRGKKNGKEILKKKEERGKRSLGTNCFNWLFVILREIWRN